MTSLHATDLSTVLKGYEGRSVGDGTWARDPVNAPMIRHWVEAMEDGNPIYVDAEAAVAAGHPGIVAPPTMLQAWGMKGLKPPPSEGRTPLDEVMDLLDAHGFTSVVATNCEQCYDRYLVEGDRLFAETVIESISEEKKTGLGTGHFVTSRTDYSCNGERVGTMIFRILKFRPAAKEANQ